MRALGAVDGEEAAHFGEDAVERPRLVAVGRLDDVAVHRIAGPHHRMALALHGADQRGQAGLDLVMAIAGDQRHAARARAPGLSVSSRRSSTSGSRLGPHFMPIGLPMPRRNSTCADPRSGCGRRSTGNARWCRTSRRSGCPAASAPARRAAAAPRGWCRSCVAVELRHGVGVDAAGLHEVERLADPVGASRRYFFAQGLRPMKSCVQRWT